MMDLKYEHHSISPCGGGSNLILQHRYRKLNIFSKNSSCYEVYDQILKNCNFGVRKKIITHPDGFV